MLTLLNVQIVSYSYLLSLSARQIENCHIVDATVEEEKCVMARLLFLLNCFLYVYVLMILCEHFVTVELRINECSTSVN